MSVTAANEATASLAKKDHNEASGSGKMMSHPDVKIPSYIGKVIIHKLCGEVYLIEQDITSVTKNLIHICYCTSPKLSLLPTNPNLIFCITAVHSSKCVSNFS